MGKYMHSPTSKQSVKWRNQCWIGYSFLLAVVGEETCTDEMLCRFLCPPPRRNYAWVVSWYSYITGSCQKNTDTALHVSKWGQQWSLYHGSLPEEYRHRLRRNYATSTNDLRRLEPVRRIQTSPSAGHVLSNCLRCVGQRVEVLFKEDWGIEVFGLWTW